MSRMKRYRQHWCWKFALGSWLVMGSAIGEAVLQTFAFSVNSAFAQITPDSTLPNNSSVTTQDNISTIEGGTQAGRNLFHSFQEFSVPNGSTAFFNNAADIQNIISRVTGGSASNIDGLIRANGTANLFLINPNGIIFGQNAQLNIGGSFVATTANALQFGNQGFFSATNPNTPPLLTVNPSALLFNQITSQPVYSIENRGFLSVGDSQSLLLVGGKISPTLTATGAILNEGSLSAPSGRVELGGLTAAGTVGLNVEGNSLSLNFSDGVTLADVTLTNPALINVSGDGGSIAINARNLDILGGSLLAGIDSGRGSVNTQAGDITLNATGAITVASSSENSFSQIFNVLNENAIGKGGNINIKAGSLSFDNTRMSTFTNGLGNAGNISIQVDDSVVIANSLFSTNVLEKGAGEGGDINIKAGSLSLNNTILGTFIAGKGNAGSISVQVNDAISLTNSSLTTSILEQAVGNGGNIEIKARSLSLTDKASIDTFSVGQGNGGNVFIQTDDSAAFFDSGVNSQILGDFPAVVEQAVRKGGDINIQTGSLFLDNEAQLNASTYGRGDGGKVSVQARDSVFLTNSSINSDVGKEAIGNGGDINIQATSLFLTDNSSLNTDISGQGNAGSIFIKTSDLVSGESSFISSSMTQPAIGNGGDINIQATSFLWTNDLDLDGTGLSTSSVGRGNAGSISVQTNDSVLLFNSSISSDLLPTAVGKGGNVEIKANSLSLYDSKLSTATAGKGDAGNVLIQANDSISLINSNIASDSDGEIFNKIGKLAGKAGDINILTGSLSLSDESRLSSSTYGQGNAGNVFVNASGSVSFASGSDILSATTSLKFLGIGESEAEGKGGNISIIADSLALDDALFAAATSGKGNAGDIFLQINDFLTLANNSQISSSVAPGSTGDGGDINIQTRSLQLRDGSQIRANVENSRNNLPTGSGQGGSIQINASELVDIFGVTSDGYVSGLSTGTAGIGKAGSLTINTPILFLSDGAQITTATLGAGEGGSLNVNASKSVLMYGISSDSNFTTGLSSRTTGTGKAGSLTITTPVLLLADGAQIDASTIGTGEGGNLNINASQWVQLYGTSANGQPSSGLFTRTEGAGKAGSLTITTPELSVYGGAQVDAGTLGSGEGGNLNINASESVLVFGESANRTNVSTLTTQAGKTATGKAGSLTINTPNLSVFDGGQISASTDGAGEGGSLNINASESVQVFGTSVNERSPSGLFTGTEGTGKAGSLTINTRELLVSNGGLISAATRSLGEGGSLNIDASKSVLVIGESASGRAVSTLSTQASQTATGKAGSLTINSPELFVLNGGQVDASTFGTGEGGSLNINASQSVQVNGISTNGQSNSVLTTRTQGTGKAGSLTINSPELFVLDGGQVDASTFGSGEGGSLNINASQSVQVNGISANGKSASVLSTRTQDTGKAGSLTINSPELFVFDGGQVDASTFGSGEGGSLNINASKTIQVIGTSVNGQSASVLSAQTQGTGKAGDMKINTQQLLISDGAEATVGSLATGVAGNLDITAKSVELNNGAISAQTFSGNGGNITLNIADLLLMRQGSEISTTAGTRQQGGDGGNIQVNIPNGFIVAVPSEDSDISANAFTGRGGRVDITAKGIFGIQPRSNPTSLSDITASSQFGVNGTVEINTPDVDPNSGLVNLPTVPVDTQVAQTCTAGSTVAKSSFTITGRGGLPPNPGEALSADAVQVDLVSLNPEVGNTPAVSTNPINPTPSRIVEATGWVIAANGDVILTSTPTVTPHSSWQRTTDCRVFNQHQGG
ncbi:filamentous hemagglutinin outer membrane protein [Nostoc commune NIES-4072]|uniref:Filamentous hemagglutinin outer membrane protein n=2 Tax=Nostoc commune TaxID=1178 RepID=A0A2R5FN19_NOSCO|nr:filamentous hemagglutinin outer membrane protein [Nostoc commune HK-02]GBG19675.1 filamentous hemagglutinin outer membrane protein [Nostoc commune NIES-4072]